MHLNCTDQTGAAGFIAAAARKLPQPDVWCIMYPSVRTLLQCDVLELDDASILSSVCEPVSPLVNLRLSLIVAIAKQPHFGQVGCAPEYTTRFLEGRSSSWVYEVEFHQVGKRCIDRREVSWLTFSADDSSALREKGFSASDEKKIIALKDFIVKQAHASRA